MSSGKPVERVARDERLARYRVRMDELPDADEIWSSASLARVHTGHSLGLVERTGIYYYSLSTDVPSEPYDHYPKTGTFRRGAEDELILDTVFGNSVTLLEIEMDGTRALVPRGREDDIESAVTDGVVLLSRSFVDLANPFAGSKDTQFKRSRRDGK